MLAKGGKPLEIRAGSQGALNSNFISVGHVKARHICFTLVVVNFMSCQQRGEPVRVQQAAHKAGFLCHVTLSV